MIPSKIRYQNRCYVLARYDTVDPYADTNRDEDAQTRLELAHQIMVWLERHSHSAYTISKLLDDAAHELRKGKTSIAKVRPIISKAEKLLSRAHTQTKESLLLLDELAQKEGVTD